MVFNGHDSPEATLSAIAQYVLEQNTSDGVSVRLLLSGSDDALSKMPQYVKDVYTIVRVHIQLFVLATKAPTDHD